MPRVVVAVVGLVLIVACAYGAWRWKRSRADEVPRYETVAVESGRLTARVTASGTLSALVTVQVGSQVSGRLVEVLVDYNSRVTKGQVLARLDPQLFQAAVDQSQASVKIAQGNLAKAKAQAEDAQRQAERAQNLFAQRIVTRADLDTATTNAVAAQASVTVSEGQLQQAQASLTQAQTNLQYTTILSPNDGIVISRSIDVGQTVAASLQAPTLFTIAEDLRRMQVDTSVSEADVGKIREGMPATFTVDAYPGASFTGTVRQVRNAAQVVQSVVTYDAVIDVANEDLRLKPGMTANATFVYADVEGLRVPNTALRFRPPADVVARAAEAEQAAKPAEEAAAAKPAEGVAKAGDGAAKPGEGAAKPGDAAAKTGDGATKPAEGDKPAADGGERPRRRRDGAGGGGAWAGGGGGRRDRGPRVVWVLKPDGPAKVTVITGVSDGSFTEIRSGLAAGDQVITDLLNPSAAAPTATATNPFAPTPPPGGMRRF